MASGLVGTNNAVQNGISSLANIPAAINALKQQDFQNNIAQNGSAFQQMANAQQQRQIQQNQTNYETQQADQAFKTAVSYKVNQNGLGVPDAVVNQILTTGQAPVGVSPLQAQGVFKAAQDAWQLAPQHDKQLLTPLGYAGYFSADNVKPSQNASSSNGLINGYTPEDWAALQKAQDFNAQHKQQFMDEANSGIVPNVAGASQPTARLTPMPYPTPPAQLPASAQLAKARNTQVQQQVRNSLVKSGITNPTDQDIQKGVDKIYGVYPQLIPSPQ